MDSHGSAFPTYKHACQFPHARYFSRIAQPTSSSVIILQPTRQPSAMIPQPTVHLRWQSQTSTIFLIPHSPPWYDPPTNNSSSAAKHQSFVDDSPPARLDFNRQPSLCVGCRMMWQAKIDGCWNAFEPLDSEDADATNGGTSPPRTPG